MLARSFVCNSSTVTGGIVISMDSSVVLITLIGHVYSSGSTTTYEYSRFNFFRTYHSYSISISYCLHDRFITSVNVTFLNGCLK